MTETKNTEESGTHMFTGDGVDDSKNICYGLRKINNSLVQSFYRFGYQVGLRPSIFIIIPVIISLALGSGLVFIKYEEDPLKLFVPYTAPFRREQEVIESHFKMNYSHWYDPLRFTRHEGHSRVIVSAKDDKSIFRSILWPEIMDLSDRLLNVSVEDENGVKYYYKDICAKWDGNCIDNVVLNINEIVGEIENGTTSVLYPVMVVPLIVPQLLGGVKINYNESKVDDALAVLLTYFLDAQSPETKDLSYQWEKKMLEFLHDVNYQHIRVSYFASRSIADELKIKMDACIPYIPMTGFIMISACMALLWMSDCIRSKPLIGLIGIISASMSAGASFGFLIYCGAVYTRLNVVAIFLVLGIGVDDIFVAISAWQKTSTKDTVPNRLAQTYADAAVSVTITSLTNALAFAVGISTPTLIVQAFCLYSCVTIIFAYVWFITFCGGFLAVAGYMEEQGRHSLFLVKVKNAGENSPAAKKWLYSLCCASASHGKNTQETDDNHVHVVSAFFRDSVGSLLCNSFFRGCVLLSLIGYLAGAIYGLTVLREGLFRHRMALDSSYFVNVSHQDDRYYRHMPYSIQVVVSGNITYSDPETQEKLFELQKKFESLPHAGDSVYSQSWYNSFLRRLRRIKSWREQVHNEKSFIKVLRENFLAKESHLSLDVEFNEDYSRILASRMVFQAANVKDVYDDVVMMDEYRDAAREEKEFEVTCFHLFFSLFDQHYMMKPLAIQSILIAIVVVVVVALLFIPDVRGSIAIACSILSIATGVLGYMSFWNINLDHVSSGSIFMCIGFSVDFSAHITYTYLSSKADTTEGKIRDSMQCLGLPIIQGGFTTILSLVTFLLIPGYGYRTFFKTIFLVTIFAAYHSIILIPLFLAKLEDFGCCYGSNKQDKEPVQPVSMFRKINGSLKQINYDSTKALPNENHTNNNTNNVLENNKKNSTNINGHLNGNIDSKQNGIDNKAFSSD